MEKKMLVTEEIKKYKQEKNAVILAHYYVDEEVQKIADHIGDSYYLSKVASRTDADIIVFCGVRFMGESAKILNPDKKVLMPDASADCAMAHMINKDQIQKMRDTYEDLAVVCYINSTAEVKMYSDVCVTSANAVKIVRSLPEKNIFFIPDGNLGRYVAEQVFDKNFILNSGYCPVHEQITLEAVKRAKKQYPKAEFLVHPECRMEILKEADYVGSTTEIIQYANISPSEAFIIGTEMGVFYELQKNNPDKKFYPVKDEQICPDMKMITTDKVLNVLVNENNEVIVNGEFRKQAIKPLEKMLELSELCMIH